MANNSPTDSREAQNGGSNGATMEHIRAEGSGWAGVLEKHTPQVAMTMMQA